MTTDDLLNPLDALTAEESAAAPESAARPIPRDTAEWNRLFAESGTDYLFGTEPSNLARTALRYWQSLYREERGPLLDLGCGEGRDAVFYAQQGFTVTAVDGSSAALEKAVQLAQQAHVRVERIHSDIRDYLLSQEFPFLHANNSLQFLGKEALPYLTYLRRRTPSGGLHAVSLMTRDYVPEQEGLYLCQRNELKLFYRDWRVLFYAEEMAWREPAQRYLSFAQIVAVRP